MNTSQKILYQLWSLRRQHGKIFRKIRIDRLHKLFPEIDKDELMREIDILINTGKLEKTNIKNENSNELISGIKLVEFFKNVKQY